MPFNLIVNILLFFGVQLSCTSHTVSVKEIPEVVCINDKLDNEIHHFLSNTSITHCTDTLYWNLFQDKRCGPKKYSCIVYKKEGELPSSGNAYLKYENHIVVIQGKLDRTFFEKVQGKSMRIMLEKRKVPDTIDSPYLEISVTSDNIFLKSTGHVETADNVEQLSESTDKQTDPFEWVSRGEESDQTIDQLLPKTVCINEVLENEIRHFLMQQPRNEGIIYWTITTHIEPYTYNGHPVFSCIISSPPVRPDYGSGYIEYDNNILILQGSVDNNLFSIVPDKDRIFSVIKNRTPWNNDGPSITVYFSEEQVLKWMNLRHY